MTKPWQILTPLHCERSIWVEEEELGQDKRIKVKGKAYFVKIPKGNYKKRILRLRGLGNTVDGQTGDLLLMIRLNKGEDIHKSLWLSETSAKKGTNKLLALDEKKIWVVIPANARDGLTLRLRGLGLKPEFCWSAPLLERRRGNLLVKLKVYPDTVKPVYRSFDELSNEHMVLEGWIYKKFDKVINTIGSGALPAKQIDVSDVTDAFNVSGWQGVFQILIGYLQLRHLDIKVSISPPNSLPGSCQTHITYENSIASHYQYQIGINRMFLDNPFLVAAIAAHELCHVIYSERIARVTSWIKSESKPESANLEMERTVDLLVFMFKLGEFQLRASRDRRITLGYFHQEMFERIQVIVSRKLKMN